MSQYKCWYSAKGCRNCELIVYSQLKPVLGMGFNGDSESHIMFIGEAPGYYENKDKMPFVGESGRLLRSYIKDSRLDDVSYITNVVKCRPPENRTPTTKEIEACTPHLIKELKLFKPKIIVLLGHTAISRFRVYDRKFINTFRMDDSFGYTKYIVYTFHPSYIIREDKHRTYDITFKLIRELYGLVNKLYIPDL